jgi:hypothetical protein
MLPLLLLRDPADTTQGKPYGSGCAAKAKLTAAQDLAVAGCDPREQSFFDLDALSLGMIFGQTHPCPLGVGRCHAGDDASVERRSGQLFVALQFTGDDFCHQRAALTSVQVHDHSGLMSAARESKRPGRSKTIGRSPLGLLQRH